MIKLAKLLFVAALLFCMPLSMTAQEEDDPKYLVGAVPEIDGRVIFSQEFSIPGMSKEQIYERITNCMAERLKNNTNAGSTIVFTDPEKGIIVGLGEEWIVFKSNALSLDRTLINYQITATCQPEKCTIDIDRIRYKYQDDQKYVAEEWITDKYALNRDKTKMIRGLAKWRTKTIDLAQTWFDTAAEALSATEVKVKVEPEKKVEKSSATNSTQVVVIKAEPAQIVTPAKTVTPAHTVIPATVIVPATTADNEMPGYRTITADQIASNIIATSDYKFVIVIGKDAFNMTMMTANDGGALGQMSGKPVVLCFLASDQPYDQLEKIETYTVRIYPHNQIDPSTILECKKLPSQTPSQGQPRIYIGEITKAWTK